MARMRPVSIRRRPAFASRDAGSYRGDLSEWKGRQVHSEKRAAAERVAAQRRELDLAANDWLAESLLSTMQHNVIGSGLVPSVRLPYDKLNLTADEALEISKRMEWVFYRWSICPDICGRSSFGEMQFTLLRTMLSLGEAVQIPVMLTENERKERNLPYSLVLQAVSPQRLRTPAMFDGDDLVRDGIRFDSYGRPVEYYICTADADGSGSTIPDNSNTLSFSAIPSMAGHRPGILHIFIQKEDEQIRGESVFSNSANLFRYVDDAIAFELQAQNMAAKFSIVMTREDPYQPMDGVSLRRSEESGQESYYSDVDGAGIFYANPGEKPEMIKSDRPSNNWSDLIKLSIGGVGGSASLSYLAVSKDYSNVNYSSARAAQNSDWKVYLWFRNFIAKKYCQRIFDMVMEEAYLRGDIEIPSRCPDFYEAKDLWCSCMWTGPSRGYMDPSKEIDADIKSVESFLVSRHEVMAAGGRDFDDELPVLMEEQKKMRALRGEPENPADAASNDEENTEVDDENTDE